MGIARPPLHRRTRKWGRQILILYYGLKDPATPFYARLPALLALIYLLSPIDLIPDFIPLAGWLDDLIIVPVLLAVSIRLFPPQVREASLQKADRDTRKARVVLGWLLILAGLLLFGLIFLVEEIFAHFFGRG